MRAAMNGRRWRKPRELTCMQQERVGGDEAAMLRAQAYAVCGEPVKLAA